MSAQARIRDDWIEAISRPAIGFFIGMALGYTAQMAQLSGWWVAVGWLVFVSILFGSVILLQEFLWKVTDALFGGPGIKKPKNGPKPHWFVRFGWMIFLGLGICAVYVLPEEVLAWI